MQQGQRPVGVGLYFSLGHSTVVFGLSVVIALTSAAIKDRIEPLHVIGGLVGTAVSAFFLLAIALANALCWSRFYRLFKVVQGGGGYVEEDLDLMLSQRGFFGRIFRRCFA